MSTLDLVQRLPNGNLKLLKDLVVETTRFNKAISFTCPYMFILNGRITIKAGFEWNGCTWARDGKNDANRIPTSWMAGCVHDAIVPVTIKGVSTNQKNLIFYDELCKVNFKFLFIPGSMMYYVGVSIFMPIRLLFI